MKQKECVCGFSGTEGKVLSHIMNKRRWRPEEDHKFKKDLGEDANIKNKH